MKHIAALILVVVACGGASAEQPVERLALPITATHDYDPDGLLERQYIFEPIDDPVMVTAPEVDWLGDDAIVLGLVHPDGEAHAFPVRQAWWHHIINTTIAGEPYLVTY